MNTCREKTIELLNEIKKEFDNDGIKYFLSGELALFEYEKIDIREEFNNATVLVFAEDVDKIIKILNEKEGRRIESLLNNSKFPGLYMRYVDFNTTLIDYSEGNLMDNNSFGVNIEILRSIPKGTFKTRLVTVLRRVLVRANIPYYMKKRDTISVFKHCVMKMATKIITNTRIASMIFKQYISSVNNKTNKYEIATVRGDIIRIDADVFNETAKTQWVGGEFSIYENLYEFVHRYFKKNRRIKPTRYIIYDFKVPWEKFSNVLKCREIKLNKYSKQERKYRNWIMKKYHPMHLKREQYYNYMFCSEDRMKMYKAFDSNKKAQIMLLYENNDFVMLKEQLQECIEMMKHYAKYKIGFCFDLDIFEIALCVMLEDAYRRSATLSEFKKKSASVINIVKYTNYRHIDSVKNVFWGEREDKDVLEKKMSVFLEDMRANRISYYEKFD